MTPVKFGSWPNTREISPLQEAFETACQRAAGQIVNEYFKRPEVVARVQAVIIAAADKAFEDGSVLKELATRMTSNLWHDR